MTNRYGVLSQRLFAAHVAIRQAVLQTLSEMVRVPCTIAKCHDESGAPGFRVAVGQLSELTSFLCRGSGEEFGWELARRLFGRRPSAWLFERSIEFHGLCDIWAHCDSGNRIEIVPAAPARKQRQARPRPGRELQLTPGDWGIEPTRDRGSTFRVMDEQEVTVALVYQQPGDSWRARDNAQVMRAAPKMFRALKRAQLVLAGMFDPDQAHGGAEALVAVNEALAEVGRRD